MENITPQIAILGVKVDNVTMEKALQRAEVFLHGNTVHHIVTVNPEFIMEAQKNKTFRDILNASSMSIPDGVGCVLMSRFSATPLRERVAGVDFFHRFLQRAATHSAKIFLFGAASGVAQTAAQKLQKEVPTLRIVGAENECDEHGYQRSDEEICSRIAHSGATIPCVAFGAPKQEEWIHRNMHNLPGIRVAIGVGGALDFFAGNVQRAPAVFQSQALEWLWRLFVQPWRFRRIFTAVILFPLACMRKRSAIHAYAL